MEYVDGTTLEQYSRAENLLPINKDRKSVV